MAGLILIGIVAICFIPYIIFCIVRADKKVSPEKYKKEKPNYQNEDGVVCCPKCKSTRLFQVLCK